MHFCISASVFLQLYFCISAPVFLQSATVFVQLYVCNCISAAVFLQPYFCASSASAYAVTSLVFGGIYQAQTPPERVRIYLQLLAEVSEQPLALPQSPKMAHEAPPLASRGSEQLLSRGSARPRGSTRFLSLPQPPKVTSEALPPASRRRGLDERVQPAARGLLRGLPRVAAPPPSAATGDCPVDADQHQRSFATMRTFYHGSCASALSQTQRYGSWSHSPL